MTSDLARLLELLTKTYYTTHPSLVPEEFTEDKKELKSLKSKLESKLAQAEKAIPYYEAAKFVKMEKPEEIKFAKYNSDMWSDFIDNKEIRIITIDGRGDEKFIYTTQNEIIEALESQQELAQLRPIVEKITKLVTEPLQYSETPSSRFQNIKSILATSEDRR